jgi:hypothetical protein
MSGRPSEVRVAPDRRQDLRVLPGRFVVEHVADAAEPLPAAGWLALVHGPDGRTVIRRDDDARESTWAAVWGGDSPHDVEATGMLSALVGPLAAAEVPVVVVSTFHADVVLVPTARLEEALQALRDAGHRVAR